MTRFCSYFMNGNSNQRPHDSCTKDWTCADLTEGHYGNKNVYSNKDTNTTKSCFTQYDPKDIAINQALFGTYGVNGPTFTG